MVQIHRGPAAVIGDERHNVPFVVTCVAKEKPRRFQACGSGLFRNDADRGEGVVSRMIRKPENLSVIVACFVVSPEMGPLDQ